MECKFVVGQKVVCVSAENSKSPRHDGLIENKIYEIDEIKELSTTKTIHLHFNEHKLSGCYYHTRFRPLSDIRNEKFKQIINDTPDWLIRDEKGNIKVDKKEKELV